MPDFLEWQWTVVTDASQSPHEQHPKAFAVEEEVAKKKWWIIAPHRWREVAVDSKCHVLKSSVADSAAIVRTIRRRALHRWMGVVMNVNMRASLLIE